MALKKRKRVIYFIKGHQPKQEQLDRAMGMAEDVVFRNANMVGPEEKCEACDAVMGFIPKQYKEAKIPVISVKKSDDDTAKQAASGAEGGEGTKGTTTAPKTPTGPAATS